MGRHYAGVLASIAFVAIVIRGLVQGAEIEVTLRLAILSLILFSIVGFLVGELAGWIVVDSVRSQMAPEKAERLAERASGVTARH